jgi:serine/threonine protein kinase
MKGQVIAGKYRVGDELARGATGTVYRAERTEEAGGGAVAVKILSAEPGARGEKEKRFEREALAASYAEHPNCVSVVDFGALDDGRPYLVMQLVEGRRLDQVLTADGALPLERALHILEHVLRGLGHAHASGVLHRDLKPGDIMLADRDGDPDFAVILDFGTASLYGAAGAGQEPLTRAGAALGNAAYMAPERLGTDPIDGRADLYSATCILFEMLSGAPPYGRDNPQALLKSHLTAPVPALPDAGLAANAGLEALILRGLGKQPAERFATADEYLKAVAALREGTLDKDSVRRGPGEGALAAPDANKATTVFHGAPQAVQQAARQLVTSSPKAPLPSLPAPHHRSAVGEPAAAAPITEAEPASMHGDAPPVAAASEATPAASGAKTGGPMRDRKNLIAAAAAGGAFLLVVILLASRGCGDDKKEKKGPGEAANTVADLEEGWKNAGLSPGGFAPIDGQSLGNGQCSAGAVNGLDVTVCGYASPELASASRGAGLAQVGSATGAAVIAGQRMLVVADRKKADASGRSIDKLIKVFQGKPLARPEAAKGDRKAPGK